MMRRTAAVLLIVLGGALAACTASENGVNPPPDTIFFPTGLAVDPRGDILYVTNGNSDLLYNGGTLLALDLGKFRDDLEPFLASGAVPPPISGKETTTDCRRDVLIPSILECRTQRYALSDQTVKLGNFGGQIAVQYLPGDGDTAAQPVSARLFIPVRGEPSVTWIDVMRNGDSFARFECGQGTAALSRCATANRLSELTTVDPTAPLPGEPYGVFADNAIGALYVTSFAQGPVSVFDMHSPNGSAPVYSDQRSNLFTPDTSARQGSVAVAPRPCRRYPNPDYDPSQPDLGPEFLYTEALQPDGPCDPAQTTDGTFIYASSHYSAEIAVLTLRGEGGVCEPAKGTSDPCYQDYRDLRLLSTGRISISALSPADDNRGLAFTPDGTRLFVLARHPPGFVAIDTSLEDGLPRNEILDAVALCPEPSLLYLQQVAGRSRAYVVCFAAGSAYVVDPTELRVIDQIAIGQGPNAMAFALQDPTRPLAFVANYVENDIAVIDLAPASPTENQVIARIAYPAPAAVH